MESELRKKIGIEHYEVFSNEKKPSHCFEITFTQNCTQINFIISKYCTIKELKNIYSIITKQTTDSFKMKNDKVSFEDKYEDNVNIHYFLNDQTSIFIPLYGKVSGKIYKPEETVFYKYLKWKHLRIFKIYDINFDWHKKNRIEEEYNEDYINKNNLS